MRLKVIMIGKTDEDWVLKGVKKYSDRLKHYIKMEWVEIPDLKGISKLSIEEQKEKQSAKLMEHLVSADHVILLDENGKEFSSREFSGMFQKRMNAGTRQFCLVIGGPFGFSKELYQKANGKISLSRMTFSHQMIRPFLVEQVYRAMTILKGEKYHHD